MNSTSFYRMDNKHPKVSVVIPVKDRKESLLRAVASVKKQTYAPHEIIVVDDGSKEEVNSYLNVYHPDVICLRNEYPKGAPYSRNRGWQQATAELVAFLDSDDEMLPEALDNRVRMMIQDELDAVVGSFLIEQGGKVKPFSFRVSPKYPLRDHLLMNSPFDARTSTFVVKRSVLEKISFDERLRKHQDWDLFINLDFHFKVGYTNHNDVILHITENDRISSALSHDATKLFIEKNASRVSPDAMFLFILKMLYKSAIRNDEYGMTYYRSLIIRPDKGVSMGYRMLALLIRFNLLNVSILHSLKKIVGRA